MTTKARAIKEKMHKLTSSQLKAFVLQRIPSSSEKTAHRMTGTFASPVSGKDLVPGIYKELLQFNNKKTADPVKRWTKDMRIPLSKDDIPIGSRHMGRRSTSLVTRQMKKIIMKCHFSATWVAIIKKTIMCW